MNGKYYGVLAFFLFGVFLLASAVGCLALEEYRVQGEYGVAGWFLLVFALIILTIAISFFYTLRTSENEPFVRRERLWDDLDAAKKR